MNYLYPIVAAVLLVLPAIAYAQTTAPADPGMKRPAPDAASTPPADSGMVVTPPRTDPESIVAPPKNVDPGIARDAGKIDKKIRKKPRPSRLPAPRE